MVRSIVKAVIGLGNPGRRYERTRHNLGRMAVRAFLRRLSDISKTEHDFSVVYRGGAVLVVEPLTYMNLSGVAVKEVCGLYRIAPQDCLAVYDDYAIPFGKMRVRARGSAGGHHGMQSVIEELQTEEIPRLRLGIGETSPSPLLRSGEGSRSLTDYVLADFSPQEQAQLAEILKQAADTLECFVQSDIQAAMNRF